MISSSSDVKAPLLYLTFTQQSIVGGKQLFHWHVLAALCWLPLYHKFIWQQTCFNVLSSSLMMLRVYVLRTNTASVVLELWTFCSQNIVYLLRTDRHVYVLREHFPINLRRLFVILSPGFHTAASEMFCCHHHTMKWISYPLFWAFIFLNSPQKNKWIKSVAGFSLGDGGNHLSERKWRVKTQRSSTLSKHNSRYLNLS